MAALDFEANSIAGNLKNITTNSNKFLNMSIGATAYE